jgi:hypothetical protein
VQAAGQLIEIERLVSGAVKIEFMRGRDQIRLLNGSEAFLDYAYQQILF